MPHTVQSIGFHKKFFTEEEAEEFLRDWLGYFESEGYEIDYNLLNTKGMHEQANFYKYRLNDPDLFKFIWAEKQYDDDIYNGVDIWYGRYY